jgi:hypothetical protein
MSSPGISTETRAILGFSLFKALEDQRDYVGAFEALRGANADKLRLAAWDADAERAKIDRIMDAFRAPLPDHWIRHKDTKSF